MRQARVCPLYVLVPSSPGLCDAEYSVTNALDEDLIVKAIELAEEYASAHQEPAKTPQSSSPRSYPLGNGFMSLSSLTQSPTPEGECSVDMLLSLTTLYRFILRFYHFVDVHRVQATDRIRNCYFKDLTTSSPSIPAALGMWRCRWTPCCLGARVSGTPHFPRNRWRLNRAEIQPECNKIEMALPRNQLSPRQTAVPPSVPMRLLLHYLSAALRALALPPSSSSSLAIIQVQVTATATELIRPSPSTATRSHQPCPSSSVSPCRAALAAGPGVRRWPRILGTQPSQP